jgi:hypothetical protein
MVATAVVLEIARSALALKKLVSPCDWAVFNEEWGRD